MVVKAVESSATRWLLLNQLYENGGINGFRRMEVNDPPTYLPLYPSSAQQDGSKVNLDAAYWGERYDDAGANPGFSFKTIQDFSNAYRAGITTPEEVAQRILDACQSENNSAGNLHVMIAQDARDILSQAQAATKRLQSGKPLSYLDGVPVAVKDEVDQVPYPTTVGTRFLGKKPAQTDSTVIARLRAAGALLIGKTNMHEIGLGVTGLNPHYGTVKNPYNPAHHTGGSSSGSAAAVAAGLCPLAVGADGGGSIRIPSAFCGVVGLKPTYGRVSEYGAAPLTWSMGHLGPIAATPLDAALGYAVLSGPDPKDPNSLYQPPLTLDKLEDMDLSDLVLGIYTPWFQHASPFIVETCERLVASLQDLGASIQEIEIPGLEAARVAHVITITSEMTTALDRVYDPHHTEFGLDVRLNLALARSFSARDYVQAQRVRTRAMAAFQAVLQKVDGIVTPTTGILAPPIRPDAQPDGESDLSQLTEIMRFILASNLTGHPAISFPAGYDPQGLPVGIQVIGRPWQEHVLLRLAVAASRLVERQAPRVKFNLL
ncbi:MAG: amidase [Anaerolineales bacterium]